MDWIGLFHSPIRQPPLAAHRLLASQLFEFLGGIPSFGALKTGRCVNG
jgi:hypothetical protein